MLVRADYTHRDAEADTVREIAGAPVYGRPNCSWKPATALTVFTRPRDRAQLTGVTREASAATPCRWLPRVVERSR